MSDRDVLLEVEELPTLADRDVSADDNDDNNNTSSDFV